jgi:hypothetical protein
MTRPIAVSGYVVRFRFYYEYVSKSKAMPLKDIKRALD